MYVYSGTCYVQWKSSTLLSISSFFDIEFEIFNTLILLCMLSTAIIKRTEKNGMPLSNPSFVMASYSLQTSGSRLLWVMRVRHHDFPKKLWSRSTYSIATACPWCSWPHIHTVALPQQLHTQNPMGNSSSIISLMIKSVSEIQVFNRENFVADYITAQ